MIRPHAEPHAESRPPQAREVVRKVAPSAAPKWAGRLEDRHLEPSPRPRTAWAWARWAAELPIPPSTKIVLLILAQHVGRDGTCYPGLGRLQRLTSLARRTVTRTLADLEAARLIERHRQRRGQGHGTTLYRMAPGGGTTPPPVGAPRPQVGAPRPQGRGTTPLQGRGTTPPNPSGDPHSIPSLSQEERASRDPGGGDRMAALHRLGSAQEVEHALAVADAAGARDRVAYAAAVLRDGGGRAALLEGPAYPELGS